MPSTTTPSSTTGVAPRRATPVAVELSGSPESRREQIDAYWDSVDERVCYLLPLLGAGRHDEAMTLCATYLEAVAHAIVASGDQQGRFVDELEQRESDPFLTLVHPLQLVRVAASTPGLSQAAIRALSSTFAGPEYTLMYQDQAISVLRTALPPTDAMLLERVIWRGTIAYLIYDFIRGHSFRRREGAKSIGLGTAFHEGETSLGLSVPELVALLRTMVAEARSRCHARGQLPNWG